MSNISLPVRYPGWVIVDLVGSVSGIEGRTIPANAWRSLRF